MVVILRQTTNAKMHLKELLGVDYSPEAKQWFDRMGYMSVTQLAKMSGG